MYVMLILYFTFAAEKFKHMKKLVLSIAAVAMMATTAQAQEQTFGFNEGDVLLEGNISMSSTKDNNNDSKESDFTFAPKAGYFLTDDFAVGVELNVSNNKNEVGSAETTTNMFGAGVFGRYYFLELGKRFKTYGEVGLGFVSTKTELQPANTEIKASGFGAGAGLGINYFVTEKIAINFALTDILSYSSMKPKDGESVNSFGFQVNEINNFFSTAQFGLTFKF